MVITTTAPSTFTHEFGLQFPSPTLFSSFINCTIITFLKFPIISQNMQMLKLGLQIKSKQSSKYIKSLARVIIKRDIHVQIIRRVITHRTICIYSQNTLFLSKSSPINSFQLFLTFFILRPFFSKE